MEKDKLNQLWNDQNDMLQSLSSNDIKKRAKKQRKGQFITILILSITVLVLIVFTIYVGVSQWNNFTLGLTLMISSLVFRVLLEFITLHRKDQQLISLDHKSFREYLKRYYKLRLKINYVITPLCFALYVIGFVKLLPYFKAELSEWFYTFMTLEADNCTFRN